MKGNLKGIFHTKDEIQVLHGGFKFRTMPLFYSNTATKLYLRLSKTTQNYTAVRCHFADTRLIWTPHYYGQFSLSLGKETLAFSLNSTR